MEKKFLYILIVIYVLFVHCSLQITTQNSFISPELISDTTQLFDSREAFLKEASDVIKRVSQYSVNLAIFEVGWVAQQYYSKEFLNYAISVLKDKDCSAQEVHIVAVSLVALLCSSLNEIYECDLVLDAEAEGTDVYQAKRKEKQEWLVLLSSLEKNFIPLFESNPVVFIRISNVLVSISQNIVSVQGDAKTRNIQYFIKIYERLFSIKHNGMIQKTLIELGVKKENALILHKLFYFMEILQMKDFPQWLSLKNKLLSKNKNIASEFFQGTCEHLFEINTEDEQRRKIIERDIGILIPHAIQSFIKKITHIDSLKKKEMLCSILFERTFADEQNILRVITNIDMYKLADDEYEYFSKNLNGKIGPIELQIRSDCQYVTLLSYLILIRNNDKTAFKQFLTNISLYGLIGNYTDMFGESFAQALTMYLQDNPDDMNYYLNSFIRCLFLSYSNNLRSLGSRFRILKTIYLGVIKETKSSLAELANKAYYVNELTLSLDLNLWLQEISPLISQILDLSLSENKITFCDSIVLSSFSSAYSMYSFENNKKLYKWVRKWLIDDFSLYKWDDLYILLDVIAQFPHKFASSLMSVYLKIIHSEIPIIQENRNIEEIGVELDRAIVRIADKIQWDDSKSYIALRTLVCALPYGSENEIMRLRILAIVTFGNGDMRTRIHERFTPDLATELIKMYEEEKVELTEDERKYGFEEVKKIMSERLATSYRAHYRADFIPLKEEWKKEDDSKRKAMLRKALCVSQCAFEEILNIVFKRFPLLGKERMLDLSWIENNQTLLLIKNDQIKKWLGFFCCHYKKAQQSGSVEIYMKAYQALSFLRKTIANEICFSTISNKDKLELLRLDKRFEIICIDFGTYVVDVLQKNFEKSIKCMPEYEKREDAFQYLYPILYSFISMLDFTITNLSANGFSPCVTFFCNKIIRTGLDNMERLEIDLMQKIGILFHEVKGIKLQKKILPSKIKREDMLGNSSELGKTLQHRVAVKDSSYPYDGETIICSIQGSLNQVTSVIDDSLTMLVRYTQGYLQLEQMVRGSILLFFSQLTTCWEKVVTRLGYTFEKIDPMVMRQVRKLESQYNKYKISAGIQNPFYQPDSVEKEYCQIVSSDTYDSAAEIQDIELGGKGSGLCKLVKYNLPVPWFVILPKDTVYEETEDVEDNRTTNFFHNSIPKVVKKNYQQILHRLESQNGKQFGNVKNPLLISVRSGASLSMPGLLDTILNVGVTSAIAHELTLRYGNEYGYKLYYRFLKGFANAMRCFLCFSKIEENHTYEERVKIVRDKIIVFMDENGLDGDILQETDDPLLARERVFKIIHTCILLVYKSWNYKEAQKYRALYGFPVVGGQINGTNVILQKMVFGTTQEETGIFGTGILFTRDPETGEDEMCIRFKQNAQGEELVSGEIGGDDLIPQEFAQQLRGYKNIFEEIAGGPADVEFTIENNMLWILQVRLWKANQNAIARYSLEQILAGNHHHKILHGLDIRGLREKQSGLILTNEVKKNCSMIPGKKIISGVNRGLAVFSIKEAKKYKLKGERTILFAQGLAQEEYGVVDGIVCANPDMFSHPAIIARGVGIPMVGEVDMRFKEEILYLLMDKVIVESIMTGIPLSVMCARLFVDCPRSKTVTVSSQRPLCAVSGIPRQISEGDVVVLDANEGHVYFEDAQPYIKSQENDQIKRLIEFNDGKISREELLQKSA